MLFIACFKHGLPHMHRFAKTRVFMSLSSLHRLPSLVRLMQLNPLQLFGSLQARFGSNQTVIAEAIKAPSADFMKEQRKILLLKSQLSNLPQPTREAPKQPPSAYILFCKDRRSHVADLGHIAELPKGERPKAIMKELAELWKVATLSEREKYVSEAQQLKQAYNEQLSTHQKESNLNDFLLDQTRLQMERSIARAERNVERILDPQLPKRPDNAHVLFLKSENAYKMGAKGVQEGAAQWKTLGDFEKEPFLKSAEQLRENYERAMAERKKSTAAPAGKVSLKVYTLPATNLHLLYANRDSAVR
ncbi:hypothetical protein BJ741DRAFT_46153 [Chytriomyces cf. hyalinus JEL632]|nr:hypothetical protein BJ741DRAFT_46153 [Chytriomyces cf. hyalinus JEL632]